MVLSATALTITIAVAADRPPMKASRPKPLAPAATGSETTKVSASGPLAPKWIRPASATGTTKTLIAIK